MLRAAGGDPSDASVAKTSSPTGRGGSVDLVTGTAIGP